MTPTTRPPRAPAVGHWWERVPESQARTLGLPPGGRNGAHCRAQTRRLRGGFSAYPIRRQRTVAPVMASRPPHAGERTHLKNLTAGGVPARAPTAGTLAQADCPVECAVNYRRCTFRRKPD